MPSSSSSVISVINAIDPQQCSIGFSNAIRVINAIGFINPIVY
jgi:hypothetical protein